MRNMTKHIDLNADLGEGDPFDAALLEIVSSCNIACGGHAGDESSMRRTVREALRRDVAIGAHPGYPDREGGGRRPGFLRGPGLGKSLLAQMETLLAIAKDEGAGVTHVKVHGALYNDSADDADLARTIAQAVANLPGPPALVGLPASAHAAAAGHFGLAFFAEAFVDRAYLRTGRLVPRSSSGAVHGDAGVIAAQAVRLAVEGRVEAISGETIRVPADTLCLHGDTPGADRAAAAVRAALEAAGVTIRACRG